MARSAAATTAEAAADLRRTMAEAADDDASSAETGTSKLRSVLDYERTKQHKTWLPDVEKDNGGKLFGNANIKELRNYVQTIALSLRKFEPAMEILNGDLKRDAEELAIFGLTIENYDDVQTTLGSDLLQTFTPTYRETVRRQDQRPHI
jgi:hypothetical protein